MLLLFQNPGVLLCRTGYQVLTGDPATKNRGIDHPGRLENTFKLASKPLHSPSVQRSDQSAVHGSSLAEPRFRGKYDLMFVQPKSSVTCHTGFEAVLQEAT
jgi:hypothetical protein